MKVKTRDTSLIRNMMAIVEHVGPNNEYTQLLICSYIPRRAPDKHMCTMQHNPRRTSPVPKLQMPRFEQSTWQMLPDTPKFVTISWDATYVPLPSVRGRGIGQGWMSNHHHILDAVLHLNGYA